jgi:hypothetical protein
MLKFVMALILFATSICGCASGGSKAKTGSESMGTADLTVTNVLTDSYRIYFVPYSGAPEVYLGRVQAGSTKKLRIKLPAGTYEDTRLLAVALHDVGRGRAIAATLLRQLKPGDLIRWELNGNHLEWIGVQETDY